MSIRFWIISILDFRFWILDWGMVRLPIEDCGLGIGDVELRIADCGLGIGDWGMRIGDCGLWIAESQTSGNPKSKIQIGVIN
jgi:hypothetical protein